MILLHLHELGTKYSVGSNGVKKGHLSENAMCHMIGALSEQDINIKTSVQRNQKKQTNKLWRGFPSSSVVRTLYFHCGGTGLIPGGEAKILHAVYHSKKKKKKKNQQY